MIITKANVFSYTLLLISIAVSSFAQPLHKGEWKTYTAMSDITGLAVERSSGTVWAVTTGGAFRFTSSLSPKTSILAFRNSDGLSDNDLTAVGADSSGKIYFGGSSGTIDIYNDSNGTITSIRDISLSSYTQKKIYQISIFASRIYFATGYGLSIYNTALGAFDETITKFGGLNDQDTVFAATEANDSIYIALSGAIAFAPKNAPTLKDYFLWHIIPAPPGATMNSVLTLRSGMIIAGSSTGLYELTGDSLRYISTGDSISVAALSAYGNTLYIIDSRSNSVITSTDLQHFTSGPLPGKSFITTSFAEANGSEKVIGLSTGGITLIPGSGLQIDAIFPDGPLSNFILDLQFVQNTNKLFLSLGGSGMSVFGPDFGTWQGYSPGAGVVPASGANSVFFDTVRNKLWISTFGDGLWSVSTPNFTNPLHYSFSANGLPTYSGNTDGFSVQGKGGIDNNGNFITTIWSTAGLGLAKTKDGNSFTGIQLNPPTDAVSFGVFTQDMDGYYYVGTVDHSNPLPYGVIAVLPDGTTYPIPGDGKSLGNASVNALIVDQDNGVWCGTNVGVDVLTHSTNFQTGNLQFNNPRRLTFTDQQIVHAITVDGAGNKWVGTANGVFVLSADGSDSLAHYTTSNSPLISNSVTAIAIDAKTGDAYIGTEKGISRYRSIYQEGAPDYSGIRVYPNPVIQHSDDDISVTITGLAGGSTVKIFSVNGRLVSTIDGSGLGSTVIWNGRDDNNKLLPSGVYIAAAASPLASTYGETKFVFIRK